MAYLTKVPQIVSRTCRCFEVFSLLKPSRGIFKGSWGPLKRLIGRCEVGFGLMSCRGVSYGYKHHLEASLRCI